MTSPAFYRATVFSNYSPNSVARPGTQWTIMAEVGESPDKPVATNVVDGAIAGFRAGAGDEAHLFTWPPRPGG